MYSFRRCPYAIRARLALAVSGQPCELREVVLKNKPPELLAASPKATVPVLVLPAGDVMDQSLDIMQWALAQHDPQGWLMPEHGTPAAMQALISENDGAFKHHLDRYKYPHRHPQAHDGDIAWFSAFHRTQAALWLAALETRLACHAWLFGARTSLADMAILPFVRQFAHTDLAWFTLQPWPHLSAWLARWEASRLFQTVMDKYPPWQSGQAGMAFPPPQNPAT